MAAKVLLFRLIDPTDVHSLIAPVDVAAGIPVQGVAGGVGIPVISTLAVLWDTTTQVQAATTDTWTFTLATVLVKTVVITYTDATKETTDNVVVIWA